MEYLTFRIGIIGASQSGKTTYVIDRFLKPENGYNFKHVFLSGLDHNITRYQRNLEKGSKLTYIGSQKDQVISNLGQILGRLSELHKQKKKLGKTLVIFDDMVDPEFIKSQPFINFMVTSRHYNIFILYLCHSPTVVLTPLMKNNLTAFVLCDYTGSHNYKILLDEFWDPILIDYLIQKNGTYPTRTNLEAEKNEILGRIFSGRYGKLIINKDQKTFSVVLPQVKSGDLRVLVPANNSF